MKKLLKLTLAAVFLALTVSPAVLATSFTQGYTSNSPLVQGTIVSLSKNSDNNIEASTLDNDSKMVGVVADSSSAIIDLQPKGTNIRVAVSGDTKVLVTTAGGDIKKGDNLIISPLAGIAQKDSNASTASKFIGVADESFTSDNSGAKTVSVQLQDGSKKDVKVGTISVNVLLSDRHPGLSSQTSSFLSRVGEHITGRPVSSLRVLAASVVMVSVFTVTGLMMNASVKGSFISLGRNPLARVSILTNLMRVVVIALVIFAVGLTASYLVLAL